MSNNTCRALYQQREHLHSERKCFLPLWDIQDPGLFHWKRDRPAVSTIRSAAPAIHPASGPVSFPLTVTLTDPGHTSDLSRCVIQASGTPPTALRLFRIGDSQVHLYRGKDHAPVFGHSEGSRHVGSGEPANQLSAGLWFRPQRGSEDEYTMANLYANRAREVEITARPAGEFP